MAYNRRRTRAQNDRSGILRHQERWLGQNSDDDPTQLVDGQVQKLENAVAFDKWVEPVSGTWLHSNLAALATGTTYGKWYHKPSKRWLFHIGTKLYWADYAVTALTEITSYAAAPASFGVNSSARAHTIFKDFNDGVIVCTQNGGIYFVNVSAATVKFFEMTAKCPRVNWDTGNADGGYLYRYLFTFSRIEDGGTNALDRISGGKVIHESGTTTSFSSDGKDYVEFGRTEPISQASSITVSMLSVSAGERPNQYYLDSSPHWNFISVYRTLDCGNDFGRDEKTGIQNDPNLYIWHSDFSLSASTAFPEQFTDDTPDDELRNRIAGSNSASKFILKSRGFVPLGVDQKFDGSAVNSTVEFFDVSNTFLIASYQLNTKEVHYSQLDQVRHAGYHNPLQNKKFIDDVRAIKVNQMGIVFCHTHNMSGGDLSAFSDVGLDGAPVFELQSFYPLDQSNGIIDYATIQSLDGNSFIAVCTDKTVRIFDGVKFGTDLADKAVSKKIKTMVSEGSVGLYAQGAYLLFYRNNVATANNDQCLRLAVKPNKGVGWSTLSGFLGTHKYHGGVLAQDTNGYWKLLVQDYADKFIYWAETYDGPTGSNLYKSAKHKGILSNLSAGSSIISKIMLRDLTGELETFFVEHQSSHLHIRAQKSYSVSNPNYTMDANGFASGFSLDLNGYADGNLYDTLIGEPYNGDMEFYKPPMGNRISIEYVLNAAGWMFPKEDTYIRVIDKKNQVTVHNSTDAGYYTELESNTSLWISRGEYLDLERIIGRRYSIYGVASGLNANATFSAITGPDLKDGSAIQFASEDGSYLWGRSTAAQAWLSYQVFNADFTLSFWVKNPDFPDMSLSGSIIKGDGGSANFDFSFSGDGVHINTPFGTIAIASILDGNWHHIVCRRTSGVFVVYQNGVIKGTVNNATILGLGATYTYIGGPGMKLFDLRVAPVSISLNAFTHYRTNIISDEGKKVLPYF